MPSRPQLQPPIRGEAGFNAVHQDREAGARLEDVELGGRVDRSLQLAGAPSKRIRQRQQNPPDLFLLLLLERDDVVVDLDRAQRLEEQACAAARTPVHDAGDRGAVFRAHDEHVATVPIRHDLLLKIFRRVFAAEVRLERSPQSRPLLAQPIPQRSQLRACVVDDVARRVDLAADVRRLMVERRRVVDNASEDDRILDAADGFGRAVN